MARKLTSGLKIAIVIAIGCAIIFAILGGVNYGYTLSNAILFAAFGVVLGAIGAPLIEPKAFSYPISWQVFFSILSCLLIAFHLQVGPEGYALATIFGAVLGYTAPIWVKHVQGP
ncbi:hypothetical protein ACFQDN_25050 [Pseudomonas asuensis]|uniref:Phage holin family protein n=1 Tax=Pseudomonas asuensis TaxID=1825787 RepID=A0ABQ2GZV2_9PSED|nr:hypothetical protein [Pseudomonas asuensis]GGM19729.1 hypothetical protein GCM10009425_33250 [Pseudomonas asuensis]